MVITVTTQDCKSFDFRYIKLFRIIAKVHLHKST